ncbi:Maf family protein [Jeotgalibaca ciconiae]|uniref:dTTP/UTP pyrophosphatase n=1 Tax=Jeotgalibaca ciconiae TaxID=2496265 RepID=A0A3Q9BKN2_9LACT|nr:Maf family protein [Jeotgalibaca ciconiae]AZP04491.1 septum formation protein Maf [Jeotgalibaca ciconiae]HJB24379.1 septum formation protein Maf [Candidatus Jeotgalibaca pullicola]
MKQSIVLASQSPRRKEWLSLCVSDFSVISADIDEKSIEKQILKTNNEEPFLLTASRLVEMLAAEKARVIFKKQPMSIVIGADTVVVHENRILGKPLDESQAYEMLRSYAGKTHSVVTGVSIKNSEKEITFSVESKVTFWDWNKQMEQEVFDYIKTGNPMDKAGAYGIQEMPSLWVKEISGDYPNIVGLPISYVNRALYEFE